MKAFAAGGLIGGSVASLLAVSIMAGAQALAKKEPVPANGAPDANSQKQARFALPFELVDGSGQVVFKIEDTGNGPILTMSKGSNSVRLGMTSSGTALQLNAGSDVASASAGGGAALFRSKAGSALATLGTADNDTGLQVDLGDKQQLHVGRKPGKNAAVRVFTPDGNVAVQLGSNPAAQGNGSLYVHGAGGQAVGYMLAKEDGGQIGITNGNEPLVTLSPGLDGSAGKVGVYTPAGTQVFAAGAVGGRGMACAYGNNKQQCLNP